MIKPETPEKDTARTTEPKRITLNLIPAFIRRRIEHRPNLLKIVDNIGWLFFDKILRMGVGLFVGVWIARYLGPEQFGLLSFATAFVGLFGAIATMGLQGIVVRDIVRDPDGKEVTLGTAAVLQFWGGLIAYGLILAVIFWLRADDALAKTIVAIVGSMMLFKASEIAVYWFESQVLSKYTVWVQNSTFLIFAAIKIGLILQNAPLIAFALAMMAEALVVALLMLLMLGLHGPRLSRLTTSFNRTKTLLADSWPLLLSGIAILVYMKIDQIMLGQMIGDKAVGIYSAAVKISEAWYFIPGIAVSSVFPAIISSKYVSQNRYYERLQDLYNIGVLFSVILAIFITIIAIPLITILFGLAYIQAGQVLSIHIWALIFVFLGGASSRWLILENMQLQQLERTILGSIINILLNLLLIPKFEIQGAAWATLISYAFVAFFYDLARKKTRSMFNMKLRAFDLPHNAIDLYKKNRL